MKSFALVLAFFGGIIGNLVVASEISGNNNELLLKSMNGKSVIMNMDTILGKEKDKKSSKKKKKESSSSSSDDSRRTSSRHSSAIRKPNHPSGRNSEPVMRQQEVREENTEFVHDDGSITVRGPIRRKPLIFPK